MIVRFTQYFLKIDNLNVRSLSTDFDHLKKKMYLYKNVT